MPLHMTFLGAHASDYGPLADPPGSSVLGAAIGWIQGAMLGSVATICATLAVAAVGFMMLTGRIDVRPALTVVLGCFILFGAGRIVEGLRAPLGAGEAADLSPSAPPPAPAPVAAPAQQADPYAGAAVPDN